MTNHAPFSIAFDAQHVARAIRLPADTPPAEALAALQLPPFQGTIVVHGGAGGMEPELIDSVRSALLQSLAPIAQEKQLLIVDGATDSGIATILGDVRAQTGGTFPLLGVTPHRFVHYPGGPEPDDERYPLNPNHSHFILVSGDAFGVESAMMVGLLQAAQKPGLVLVINGGQVVLQEVQMHARAGNLLVTLRGSGRMADQIADPASNEHGTLPDGAHVYIADMAVPETLAAMLADLFATEQV